MSSSRDRDYKNYKERSRREALRNLSAEIESLLRDYEPTGLVKSKESGHLTETDILRNVALELGWFGSTTEFEKNIETAVKEKTAAASKKNLDGKVSRAIQNGYFDELKKITDCGQHSSKKEILAATLSALNKKHHEQEVSPDGHASLVLPPPPPTLLDLNDADDKSQKKKLRTYSTDSSGSQGSHYSEATITSDLILCKRW